MNILLKGSMKCIYMINCLAIIHIDVNIPKNHQTTVLYEKMNFTVIVFTTIV